MKIYYRPGIERRCPTLGDEGRLRRVVGRASAESETSFLHESDAGEDGQEESLGGRVQAIVVPAVTK